MTTQTAAGATDTAALVYSTSTGQEPTGLLAGEPEFTTIFGGLDDSFWAAFCFVCNRCTEHAGEHDDLVDAGLAVYAENGNVYTTEAYTDATAVAVIRAAESLATR